MSKTDKSELEYANRAYLRLMRDVLMCADTKYYQVWSLLVQRFHVVRLYKATAVGNCLFRCKCKFVISAIL